MTSGSPTCQVLAADRGEITDRNGVAVAAGEDAYDITADPEAGAFVDGADVGPVGGRP